MTATGCMVATPPPGRVACPECHGVGEVLVLEDRRRRRTCLPCDGAGHVSPDLALRLRLERCET